MRLRQVRISHYSISKFREPPVSVILSPVNQSQPGMCACVVGLQLNRATGRPWFEVLGLGLASLSGRRSPQDAHELFEAATLLLVDFTTQPLVVEWYKGTLGWDEFFEALIDHVKDRNPTLRNRLAQS